MEIYIVDDFVMVNILHEVLLRNIGTDILVKSFIDPGEALKDLGSRTDEYVPTLLLLDIHMPEMSGSQFLERMELDGFPRTIDVIIVTTSVSDRGLAEQYPQYVRDFVRKPLKLRQVGAITEYITNML